MLGRGRWILWLWCALGLAACGGRLPSRPPNSRFITTSEHTFSLGGPPWPLVLLVGVVLGLLLAGAWRRWALQRALRQERGLALGREMGRLKAALAIIDDLLLNWPRQSKMVDLVRRLRRRGKGG